MHEQDKGAPFLLGFKRTLLGDTNVEIFCDGSGLGGYGWIVKSSSGAVLHKHFGKHEGDAPTNNICEYEAVITALEWIKGKTTGKISVFTDSMLVVSQVAGTWRCKKVHLQPLQKRAKALVNELDVKLAWIPRAKNKEADELSHGWENESKDN